MLRRVLEHRVPVHQDGLRGEVLSDLGKAVVIHGRGGHMKLGGPEESL
jgi:hypothetical protein